MLEFFHKPNTYLFQTHTLFPWRFSLDKFHFIPVYSLAPEKKKKETKRVISPEFSQYKSYFP